MSVVLTTLCGIAVANPERRLAFGRGYLDVLENMAASAASGNLSDSPEIPNFQEQGSTDGSFHVGIIGGMSSSERRLGYNNIYLDVLENMASAASGNLSDSPEIPEFAEQGSTDGSFHVGIPLIPEVNEQVSERRLGYNNIYLDVLENMASAASGNLSDSPEIPEFAEQGSRDGSFHVGIPLIAEVKEQISERRLGYNNIYLDVLENMASAASGNRSDSPEIPEFAEQGSTDGSFHVGIPLIPEVKEQISERRLGYNNIYLDVLEDMASAASGNLSDSPEIPDFAEQGSTDGSFHVGIPLIPEVKEQVSERRLSFNNDYLDVLENLAVSAASGNLSDSPEIPEFEEQGSTDGSLHVGIPAGLATERRLMWSQTYLDVLETTAASAASGNLSEAPEIPNFEEHGSTDGSFHVGIPAGLASSEPERERRLAWWNVSETGEYLRTVHDMETMDKGNLPWPFLVEFQTIPEMNAAIEHHMMSSPGKFQRLSMPALGDVNVTKMVKTKWLAPSQLEMSCHTDMEPALCHRFLPGDFFGITCVRYVDPSSGDEVTQLAGMACHQVLHKMCHLGLDFVVTADIAAQVQCPSTAIMV